MPTTNPCPNDVDGTLRQSASDIRLRHRGHLRELRIEVTAGGVILHGRATSYYGKQIAFHEVSRRCKLVVVANRIEVQQQPVG